MGSLKRFPRNAVWALAVQFLLGIYINMYVEFPEGESAWEFARGNVWILLHIMLGLLILLGAISYVVAAFRQKQKQIKPYAVVGLLAVLLAIAGGERFVTLQDDLYSMLMAVGFIGAIVTYAFAGRVPVDSPSGRK